MFFLVRKKKLNSLHFQRRNQSRRNDEKKKVEIQNLATEISHLGENDRNNFLSERILSYKMKELTDLDRCLSCWLVKRWCSCCSTKDKIETDMKNEFLFYMHPKEFGRGSNTAVTVVDAFPHHSKIFVAGIEKDEEELAKIIEKEKGNVFVLTPSPQSMSFSEIKATRNSDFPNQKFTFIFLDGTWDQTKRLSKNKVLADIPHLKLDCAGNTMSTMRKQTNFGRVTTAEAAMLLLDEMGFEKEVSFLRERIERKIFRAQLQRGKIEKERLPKIE